MTDQALMRMAADLLCGRSSPGWAGRAGRVLRILTEVLGPEPPEPEIVPSQGHLAGAYARMLPTNPARPQAIETAESIFQNLVQRRFSSLEGGLHHEVWTLWPTGRIGHHPRQSLLNTLRTTQGRPSAFRTLNVRSYTLSDLSPILARGLPALLDAIFDLSTALMVTFEVQGPQGGLGRVMLIMGVDETGQWRARNLPFGAPDDAYVASQKPHELDDDGIRAADGIVRNVVLGQAGGLRANRNRMMDRIRLRDEVTTPEILARLVGRGDHRLGSTEIVFLDSREVPMAIETDFASRKTLTEIKQTAPDVFGRRFERYEPRFMRTEIGELDTETGEIRPIQEAAALLLRVEDPNLGRHVERVGALWI